MSEAITVSAISKSFAGKRAIESIFSELSFVCAPGTFTSIVGPSGCGKSTLLNLLAGLEAPDAGTVKISQNPIGYMMQDPLLLSWRTLEENAFLGAEIKRRNSYRDQCSDYFVSFGLAGSESIYPNAASGGMKQRVAIVRTLLTQPQIMLLDEPFSSLDFDTKLRSQQCVLQYQKQHSATVLLVTHDIEDAIALSDRVIVLAAGKPTSLRRDIKVNLDMEGHDPVEARRSERFREYFVQIWDELKLLENVTSKDGSADV